MKLVRVATRAEWRAWLAENHDKETAGIWLVYFKPHAKQPTIDYEESVEEALCFGWIDSLIKRIDDDAYCRKFTPRRDDSLWSDSNKKRIEKIIREGKMTEIGLAKIKAAKKSGLWEKNPRPSLTLNLPLDFSAALAQNKKARDFFDRLAPSHQKHFIAWIATAKRPETRTQRIKESLALLSKGQKLGLR